MVQLDKSHSNEGNEVGVGLGHEQAHKEGEFELSISSSSSYKRILIVDDEPDIAMTLKIGLESNNDSSDYSDKKKITNGYKR